MLVLALIIPSTMTISSTPPTQPHPFPSHPKRNGDAQTQSTNKAKPRKKHSHKATPGKKVSPSLEMSKHIPRRHVPISPAIPRTRSHSRHLLPARNGPAALSLLQHHEADDGGGEEADDDDVACLV